MSSDESALSMNDVAHIPQTAASHRQTPTKQRSADADMLIEDRRDSFYKGQLRRSIVSTQSRHISCLFPTIPDASTVQVISSY